MAVTCARCGRSIDGMEDGVILRLTRYAFTGEKKRPCLVNVRKGIRLCSECGVEAYGYAEEIVARGETE